MIEPRMLASGVHWAGVVDWSRRLFDALIPLPEGTSYNAYIIEGTRRTALVDSMDPAFAEAWLEQVAARWTPDVLIANHAEQDHSGALPRLIERFPKAEVLCSPKAKPMLHQLLGIPEDRLRTVADGETLDLGGRTLRFVHLPWVHWPETMGVWLEEERMLFPCDFFGSHLATSCLYADEDARTEAQARLYFAQIMMPYAPAVRKDLAKVRALDPAVIAPSHGPVWRRPAAILDLHEAWLNGPTARAAVLARVSMHGSTGRMAEALETLLVARGVEVRVFDFERPELDRYASALVDAGAVVFAAPAVWSGPHPAMLTAMGVTAGLKPKAATAAFVGSYGWSSKGLDTYAERLAGWKAEALPPVLCAGRPGPETMQALAALADDIAGRLNAPG
jgi:flavorubredoxin